MPVRKKKRKVTKLEVLKVTKISGNDLLFAHPFHD
jgi:hypothetical protein